MIDSTFTTAAARRSTGVLAGETTPYWILRIAAALCFVGHGAFGFITKAAWLPYFGVVGIPESWAWQLMPWIGAVDVTVGMAVLFAPRRAALAYMALWGLWTAMLRPLAGESIAEALERAGNYGVPLALLVMAGLPRSRVALFGRVDPGPMDPRRMAQVQLVLRWTTVLLLAGHGALGAIEQKALLTQHYAAIGLPASVTPMAGWFELALAGSIALRPMVGVLLLAACWKLGTESLFVASGAPIWEFVERAGSYAAPMALAASLVVSNRRLPRLPRSNQR